MKLVDTHCHIHDQEFFDNQAREAIYQRAIDAGIGMVVVGTDQASSAAAVDFAKDRAMTWSAVGVHPHEAKHGWSGIASLVEDQDKVVAIGEIGLDYYYNHSPREIQIQALEAQLQIAVDHNLPVSFHVRQAFEDFWPVCDNFSGVRGVLHSFTDTAINAEKGMSRGLYIGINGISTFTKDAAQQELYARLPLENILLETDAPFLTPAPLRGKVNESEYVELIAQFLAEQRAISVEEVARFTLRNTRELFNV